MTVGYAPLPRPSMAGPVGGAVLPTSGGFVNPKGNTGARDSGTGNATHFAYHITRYHVMSCHGTTIQLVLQHCVLHLQEGVVGVWF